MRAVGVMPAALFKGIDLNFRYDFSEYSCKLSMELLKLSCFTFFRKRSYNSERRCLLFSISSSRKLKINDEGI